MLSAGRNANPQANTQAARRKGLVENIIAAVVDGLITSLIHLFFTKKNHSDGLKKTKKELVY